MDIILPTEDRKDKKTARYHSMNTKNLLLIFTRNPVLGQCKTRLAATVGDQTALDIYRFLLSHTRNITKGLHTHKRIYYSNEIQQNDIWDPTIFEKRLQQGNDLGERMANAFQQGFEDGFKNIIIVGSDMYDLTRSNLEDAFLALQQNDFVLGPAEDGGYYLLGMTCLKESLFKDKDWGKGNVFQNTLEDLKNEKVHLLETKNDIDVYEDIEHIEAFKPYFKNI